MPHTNAWNELKPAGTDLASTIDDHMRQIKKDIRERMSLEHIWGDDLDNDGRHRNITFTAADNASLLSMAAANTLDGANAQSLLDLKQIWNTTGKPSLIKGEVTDTASDPGSRLLDFIVNGAERFWVDKAGNAKLAASLELGGNLAAAGYGSFGGILTANGGAIVLNGSNNIIPGNLNVSGTITAGAITGGIASSGDVTIAGDLTVNGLGLFTKNVAGGYGVTVRNTGGGANYFGIVQVGNDASDGIGRLMAFSTFYTSSGPYINNGFTVEGTAAGGLNLAAGVGSDMRFFAGATERMRLASNGRIGIGTATPQTVFEVAGGYATSGLTAPTGLGIAAQAALDRVQLIFGDSTGYKLHFGGINAGNFLPRLTIYDHGRLQTLRDGTVAEPSISFLSADAGMYMAPGGLYRNLAWAAHGENIFTAGKSADNVMGLAFDGVHPRLHPQWGGGFVLYRNSGSAGAPGFIAFQAKNGTNFHVWVDTAGKLRINMAGPPNNGDGIDTIGTVVGSQS